MSNGVSSLVGSVGSLWRYPVKSMRGEELTAASVIDQGFLGDRAYALIDSTTGKIASAKHPRKWGKLLGCHAAFTEPLHSDTPLPPVTITLPNGTMTTSEHDAVHPLLSDLLQRQVTLTTTQPESPSVERVDGLDAAGTIMDTGPLMMPGRFSDYAAVHLITTATLERLQTLYPQGHFAAQRFRPNIVVNAIAGEPDFIENAWVGQTLAIGDNVRLRITDPCPRCVLTTLAQDQLPDDLDILKTVAHHNQATVPALDGKPLPCAGVYAFVSQGGTIRCGDSISIESNN